MSYNVGYQIGNAFWQLCETFSGRNVFYIIGLQSFFLRLLCLQLFKTVLARFFFLVSLGGNDYPWEIVGIDFVTRLYGPQFHFTTIIDSCLTSQMAHFLSYKKKSSLTKQWIALFIIDIDFILFHKSLCLTNNPALLAKFANLLWGNWIPNSSRVRLDILKLMALLNVLIKQCK